MVAPKVTIVITRAAEGRDTQEDLYGLQLSALWSLGPLSRPSLPGREQALTLLTWMEKIPCWPWASTCIWHWWEFLGQVHLAVLPGGPESSWTAVLVSENFHVRWPAPGRWETRLEKGLLGAQAGKLGWGFVLAEAQPALALH